MMHCVFYAIKDHLSYLGIETLHDDWLIYEGARTIADNRGYTSICIVPFICISIANRHNLECKIQMIMPFNIKWHNSQATENEKLLLMLFPNEYSKIGEEAIYFPKFTLHAQFLLREPKEDYIMRIQFKEKQK